MATVYLKEQGAVLRKRGQRLVVTKEDQELMEVPLIHVDQVAVLGNVQVTTPAVATLLQNQVDVVFFSRYGKFRGRLTHTGSKFARLRQAQLQKAADSEVALSIARAVVGGKLANQRTILRRRAGELPPSPQQARIAQAIQGIGRMLERTEGASSPEELRGYEGQAGACYFDAFRVLVPEEMHFQGRAYYPPPDPVNALLSFGYSLLLKDVTGAVQLVGLDAYLGFFHAVEYGRPSLALDVMEEFRPLIVDTLVLQLLGSRVITSADFVWTRDPKRPVHLSEGAVTLFLERYEERINTQVYHPGVQQQTSYRRCFELQVRQVARIMLDKATAYRPLIAR